MCVSDGRGVLDEGGGLRSRRHGARYGTWYLFDLTMLSLLVLVALSEVQLNIIQMAPVRTETFVILHAGARYCIRLGYRFPVIGGGGIRS